ncbi:MAG: hypothetical protein FJX23_04020 [Alphaproteobacteria bacterium]|nr:hypothetical protein [Alphaproteobacteria bacterium]
MAKGGKQKKTKGKKKGGVGTVVLGLFATLILIYFLSFAALLVILGLVPSFVAGYVDRTPDKAKAKVVAACNLAGIVPFVSDLVKQGITSNNVHSVLLSGYTWLVMLGAAGLGWALVWGFPKASHAVLGYMQKSNVAALRKRQQQIIDEWGKDVETTAQRALKNSNFRDEKQGEAGGKPKASAADVKKLPPPKKK